MGYEFNDDVFKQTFFKSKGFKHEHDKRYPLFPYTSKNNVLTDFDNIFVAFLQDIYGIQAPEKINRNEIISSICKDVSFTDNLEEKNKFISILKDIYFNNEHSLKCNNINFFKYVNCSKEASQTSEYIVSTICDKQVIANELVKNSALNANVLDKLVESHLPNLSEKKAGRTYLALFPEIKRLFTQDIIFLIKSSNAEFSEITRLISYYYFFYVSQVVLMLNRFFNGKCEVVPVYFCISSEKTSQSRNCFQNGWRKIDGLLDNMLVHAVLLEILNQTDQNKKYSYKDFLEEYNNSSEEDKGKIFTSIENVKQDYRYKYVPEDGFSYVRNNYSKGNIESLIHGFFDDILLQFNNSKTREDVHKKFKKCFYLFCKNNFLQHRGKNGLMLTLDEETIVLFTKIIIGNRDKIRLNELFNEFRKRGIFMDRQTQECVVDFYEKLNLIEKKSDSGDAQYVKGIL